MPPSKIIYVKCGKKPGDIKADVNIENHSDDHDNDPNFEKVIRSNFNNKIRCKENLDINSR